MAKRNAKEVILGAKDINTTGESAIELEDSGISIGYDVYFKGYHYNNGISSAYTISHVTVLPELPPPSVTPPTFTGTTQYSFKKWSSYAYSAVTSNLEIYALCTPSWEVLKTYDKDTLYKLCYTDEINNGEFRKVVGDETVLDKIYNKLTASEYRQMQPAGIGKYADSNFAKDVSDILGLSNLDPHNPESGKKYDEAAANSIINIKNVEIIFKPKAYQDESKDFIENKVMPYLTSVIPSTTIFSYKFSGEEEGVTKEIPVIFYNIDNQTDNTKYSFESIPGDNNSFHVTIASLPESFTLDMSPTVATIDNCEWLNMDIDSDGKGFTITCLKDNYEDEDTDTSGRTYLISGCVKTDADVAYSGIATQNISINCEQLGYDHTAHYKKLSGTVLVDIEAYQDIEGCWDLSYTLSGESIPNNHLIVCLAEDISGVTVESDYLTISGTTWRENVDMNFSGLNYDNVNLLIKKADSWVINKDGYSTAYFYDITSSKTKSDEAELELEPVEDYVNYSANTTNVMVYSNTDWAFSVMSPSGSSLGEYTGSRAMKGYKQRINLDDEYSYDGNNRIYVLSGLTTNKSVNIVSAITKIEKYSYCDDTDFDIFIYEYSGSTSASTLLNVYSGNTSGYSKSIILNADDSLFYKTVIEYKATDEKYRLGMINCQYPELIFDTPISFSEKNLPQSGDYYDASVSGWVFTSNVKNNISGSDLSGILSVTAANQIGVQKSINLSFILPMYGCKLIDPDTLKQFTDTEHQTEIIDIEEPYHTWQATTGSYNGIRFGAAEAGETSCYYCPWKTDDYREDTSTLRYAVAFYVDSLSKHFKVTVNRSNYEGSDIYSGLSIYAVNKVNSSYTDNLGVCKLWQLNAFLPGDTRFEYISGSVINSAVLTSAWIEGKDSGYCNPTRDYIIHSSGYTNYLMSGITGATGIGMSCFDFRDISEETFRNRILFIISLENTYSGESFSVTVSPDVDDDKSWGSSAYSHTVYFIVNSSEDAVTENSSDEPEENSGEELLNNDLDSSSIEETSGTTENPTANETEEETDLPSDDITEDKA